MFHNKKWISSNPNGEIIDELSKELNISHILAMVLVNRGINSVEEADRFLHPDMNNLGDPYLLPDMQKAVERIVEAINKNEKICVYGDYDVDGITSVTVMIKALESLGADVFYYIPDRMDEGYGLNKSALEEIRQSGAGLVITVDCGIVSFEEVAYGNSLGINMIITDHHQSQDKLPPALGVINPKIKDSNYPFKELAGVGVAYNLCRALEIHIGKDSEADSFMDIVALGTVADLVPLVGENRILVKEGLKAIRDTKNQGLKALIKVSGLEGKEMNTLHIAFMLAPRINAAGRLSTAKKGVELLLTGDPDKAMELARELDTNNKERQAIDKRILDEAIKLAEQEKGNDVLVLASPDWHPGVIGIVASRVTEKFNKPSILFCIEEGEARGSARSIPGLDIYHMLSQCSHLYNKFGGHKQAAGLALDAEKLEEFTREINIIALDYMQDIETRPVIKVEGELTGLPVTPEDIEHLKRLEPCGFGNPAPLFVKRGIEVLDARKVGKNKNHLKLAFKSVGGKVDGIFFGCEEGHVPLIGEKVDIVFAPEINNWMNKNILQFNVKDIKKIEENVTFLTTCYTSMNRLIERENQKGNGNTGLLKGIKVKKIDDRNKYIFDTFKKCCGNILIVNTFRGAVDMISSLSVHEDTCICFGGLEDYHENKNYLLIYPVNFENFEACKGKLFFYEAYIFPGQMEWLTNLERIDEVLLVDGKDREADDFSALLPDREIFERVYMYICENKRIHFNHCLYVMRRMGYNSMAVIRAVDTLKYTGLIKTEACYLVALPTPREKVVIQDALPYSSLKKFIKLTGECYKTVKKYSVDI